MFGLGPIIAMIIGPRVPTRAQRPRMRHSVIGTDLALVTVVGVLCWLIGWKDFLLVWAPAAMLAGSVGIWLFYVQHQFEDAYWQSSADWSYADAALQGSSYLRLPKVLQFFTGNIGLHHVHHLNARIPNYNLQRAHDENPIFHERADDLALGRDPGGQAQALGRAGSEARDLCAGPSGFRWPELHGHMRATRISAVGAKISCIGSGRSPAKKCQRYVAFAVRSNLRVRSTNQKRRRKYQWLPEP